MDPTVAVSAPSVSLREIAAAAHERSKAERAERSRQEIERRRERLAYNAYIALENAFQDGPSDPWGLSPEIVRAAEIEIGSTDDVLRVTPDLAVVVIRLQGERFEWKRVNSATGDFGLVHVYDCSTCGLYQESDGIRSLAELGEWIAQASRTCRSRGCESVS